MVSSTRPGCRSPRRHWHQAQASLMRAGSHRRLEARARQQPAERRREITPATFLEGEHDIARSSPVGRERVGGHTDTRRGIAPSPVSDCLGLRHGAATPDTTGFAVTATTRAYRRKQQLECRGAASPEGIEDFAHTPTLPAATDSLGTAESREPLRQANRGRTVWPSTLELAGVAATRHRYRRRSTGREHRRPQRIAQEPL